MLRVRERQAVLGECLLHEFAAEVLRAVPEPFDHRQELRHSRARIGAQMKLAIELDVALQSRDAFEFANGFVERVDVRFGQVRHALENRQRLHDLADLVDLDRLFGIDVGDPGAAIGGEYDEALVLELLQRLAHRDAAGAELGGQQFLTDAHARPHFAAEHRAADFVGDARAEQAARRLRWTPSRLRADLSDRALTENSVISAWT